MRKFFKHAKKIEEPREIQKYAAVISKNGREFFGLFDISSKKAFQEAIVKLAENHEEYPDDIRAVAMGVINTEYMNKYGSNLPLFYGIPCLKDNIIDLNEIAEIEKTSEENRFGYVLNDIFLPLDNAANIKAASDLLEEHTSKFDGLDRVKFASKIKVAARKHNVKTNKIVEKYASDQINLDFYELMDQRIKIAENYPETLKVLQKIRKDAPSKEPIKIAEELVVVDNMLPFSMKMAKESSAVLGSDSPRFYSSINVPDAFETVFGVVERPLRFHEKVASLDREKLATVFSDVFIDRLMENPRDVIDRASPEVVLTLKELAD